MSKIFKIRLYSIEIPRPLTSITKRIPEYEIPLWQAKWRDHLDPGQKISVPKPVPDVFGRSAFMDVELDTEEQRLREQFGDWFDRVYTVAGFRKAFMDAVNADAIGTVARVQSRSTPALQSADELVMVDTTKPLSEADRLSAEELETIDAVEPDDLTKLKYVDEEDAKMLESMGLRTYAEVAEADTTTIMELDGVGAARAAIIIQHAKQLADGVDLAD